MTLIGPDDNESIVHDHYVEYEYVSYWSRLRESAGSALAGLMAFLSAFPLLVWNEKMAVERRSAFEAIAEEVVSVSADRVDPSREKAVVHVTGDVELVRRPRDDRFGLEASALRLRRRVEMYQWEETKDTESRKTLGGGTERRHTYSYSTRWAAAPISSKDFHHEIGHTNPVVFPFYDETHGATARLGAFTLSDVVTLKLDDFRPHPLTDAVASTVAGAGPVVHNRRARPHKGWLVFADNPEAPKVGDIRVSFETVAAGPLSVIAEQRGDELVAHRSGHETIAMVERGTLPPRSLVKHAEGRVDQLTWGLRLCGYLMMVVGIYVLLRPIAVVGDVIPLLGSVLAFGAGLFALVVALPLALGTVAAAWFTFRPQAAKLLAAAAPGSLVLVVWLRARGARRRLRTA